MDKQTTKRFVISDPHGFYTETMAALERAGYDSNDPTHLLICLGDVFDRGTEQKPLLDFFLSVENKVMIRGNHDARLAALLEGARFESYDKVNGTIKTLEGFFGRLATSKGSLRVGKEDETVAKIKRLLADMVDYYEWGDYIFTHGWLPVDDALPPVVLPDWRNASSEAWEDAQWAEWQQFYGKVALPEGKTLVCGHRSANLGHLFDPTRFADDYTPFYGDHLIALDACTARSGVVNVLVLEGDD